MRRVLVIALLVALLGAACTGSADPATQPAPTESTPSERAEGSPAPTEDASPTQSPRAPETSPPPHPVSLPALFDEEYDGRALRLGRVLVRTDAYTQHAVTYRGDGLRVSGTLNLPRGPGPFPVLVLAHGYIDPAVYVTGQGLRREQDWLARAGFAVLHVDYRNHAGSDRDPRADKQLRLGYTVDVINAVHAVRRSGMRRLDGDRVGLLGRSMGGGVAYNVLAVAPGLVDAAVVFAPVSSRAEENFDRWIRFDPGRADLARRIIRAYGAPEGSRRFWREVSPRTYFDRVTEPVLIHHGTADESCPIRWSRQTRRAMRQAGVDVSMFVYPGEPHAFEGAWPTSMRRTVRFFERNLG
jgi:uncharacterized protein